ncbi:CDP-glycerol glycerophosphotransferase family protein [Myxococcota bacterium]|nr:CDP-glycerol glycerophosphotransferase family protein [Myxococcota bacterium]MBU1432092.1 CDP-glycerol glycerophosphotransferase family protein [Myxococcota bacterium]MBU1896779.1 CDP-glycerol glycerophosphotransferase family protein [Myxococcota bacterium]
MSIDNGAQRDGRETPLRVCFWTTTLQADVLTLARHLTEDPRFEVLVIADEVAAFLQEPIQRLRPLTAALIDKADPKVITKARAFRADITVVDNHFPPKALSPLLFVLWHGFGWKGPNDIKEFAAVHRDIKRLTKAPSTQPNPRFLWQCFGPTDLEHRHAVSGFARENLASLGAAFTDDLITPTVPREVARAHYPALAGCAQIVLVALTWHYGRALAHWGDDLELFKRLLDALAARGAGVILRMHDRRRFEPDYLAALEALVAAREGVIIKFKDEDRDSLLDLSASDVMVSNYSSILNYFYATQRPSIHVYPVASASEAFLWRTWKRGKVRIEAVPSADYVWKLPPEEHGGLLARDFEGLIQAIYQGLDDPGCSVEAAARFMTRHMAPVDGRTSARIATALRHFAAGRKDLIEGIGA